MSREVALYDAKNSLSTLVSEVETSGEEIVITRHGKPAAKLTPVQPKMTAEERAAIFKEIAEHRERLAREYPRSAEPLSWEELKADMEDER